MFSRKGCCRWFFEEKATKLQVDYALRRIAELERKVLEMSLARKRRGGLVVPLKPFRKKSKTKMDKRGGKEDVFQLPCGCVLKKEYAEEPLENPSTFKPEKSFITSESICDGIQDCGCGFERCRAFDGKVEGTSQQISKNSPNEEKLSRKTVMIETEPSEPDGPKNRADSRKTGPNRRMDADFHCMPVPLAAYGKERALKRHYACNPLRYRLPEVEANHVGENGKLDVVAIPKKKKKRRRIEE